LMSTIFWPTCKISRAFSWADFSLSLFHALFFQKPRVVWLL
jgi:hypothetical protein